MMTETAVQAGPLPWWRRVFELVRAALKDFGRDHAGMMGAALAYYLVFAIGPLLVIATGVAGIVFGEAAAEGLIQDQLEGVLGPEVAKLVQDLVAAAGDGASGVAATAVGVVLLLFAASALVLQLQNALNVVFDVPHAATGGIKATILARLRSLAGVIAVGALVLAILAANAAVAIVSANLPVVAEWVARVGTPLLSLLLGAGLLALTFRYLPQVRTPWRPVLIGAAVTSVLLAVGAAALGFYLSVAGSAAFAAGPIVALLFFAYYMAQILIFGAELTDVLADGEREVEPPTETAPTAPGAALVDAGPVDAAPAAVAPAPPGGAVIWSFVIGLLAGSGLRGRADKS